MCGTRVVTSAVVLLAFSTMSVQAQTVASPIQLDSRIRVTSRSDHGLEAVGALSSWTEESLEVSGSGVAPISIPLSEVARLEVSQGTKRHTLIGLAAGAGLGLVVGLVAAGNNEVEPATDFWGRVAQEAFEPAADVTIVAGSTLLGAGIGALVGLLIRTEKWEEVEMPEVGPAVEPVAVGTAEALAPIRMAVALSWRLPGPDGAATRSYWSESGSAPRGWPRHRCAPVEVAGGVVEVVGARHIGEYEACERD